MKPKYHYGQVFSTDTKTYRIEGVDYNAQDYDEEIDDYVAAIGYWCSVYVGRTFVGEEFLLEWEIDAKFNS